MSPIDSASEAMRLDSMTPVRARVGYGAVGVFGSLGYEGKNVSVRGCSFDNAISAHPPARLTYHLRGRYEKFSALVALNDDVPSGATSADFSVWADGRRVAWVRGVSPGEPPRALSARIDRARILELAVETNRWDYCHAVWLQPTLNRDFADPTPGRLRDCLDRTEIVLPSETPRAELCIATIVSAGFENLLEDLLGSLAANGCCPSALVIVLAIDCTDSCRPIAASHGATLIECHQRSKLNPTVKSALYTLPLLVEAQQFLCLDADTVVLGDVRPIFERMTDAPEGSVFAAREANGRGLRNLAHAISAVYWGDPSQFSRILGHVHSEPNYPLVVNDGVFAGSRPALIAVDKVIRSWRDAPGWVDERRDVWWRNQFVFNLALASLNCGVELEDVYNVQLDSQNVEFCEDAHGIRAAWNGQTVRILHCNGRGRHKYPEWRGRLRATG